MISSTMPRDTSGSRAHRFLIDHGMDPCSIDPARETVTFLEEMDRGLSGKPSSLRMIPTYLAVDAPIPAGERVVAVDAGGTFLRVALVEFDAELRPRFLAFSSQPMPGSDRTITADEFFLAIAEHLLPLVSRTDRVGLSFSYPAEILPSRDGRILELCKELHVTGAAGQLLGGRLREALAALGWCGDLRITVLNDTVGALLAGRVAQETRPAPCLGFVLGTGQNCSYVERNVALRNAAGLGPGQRQVVNIESGAYDRFPRGALDLAFDEGTADPGRYVLEKTMSGAYLGPLFSSVLRAAGDAGLFAPGTTAALRQAAPLNTRALNAFLGSASDDAAPALASAFAPDDLATATALAQGLLERAARLAAITLAGALIRSEAADPGAGTTCVVVEGSTFHGLHGFAPAVTHALDGVVAPHGIRYRLASVSRAALVGAAVAGLTH